MFDREGNFDHVIFFFWLILFLSKTKLVYFSGQCIVLSGTADAFSSDLILSMKSAC